MSKKIKKALSFVLVIAMTVGATIAGTFAYLTDRDSKANVFTVGDVDIELNEEFEQGSTLTPGVDITKEPTIKNVGKNDAWVWATIAIPSALDNPDASKNVIHFNFSEEAVADGQWKWIEAEDWSSVPKAEKDDIEYNVYTVLYQTKLAKDEVTFTPVIHKVYMDDHVDIDKEGNWYHIIEGEKGDSVWNSEEDGDPKIYVSAYAMQAEGYDNVEDAYEAYVEQWGEGNYEWEETVVEEP